MNTVNLKWILGGLIGLFFAGVSVTVRAESCHIFGGCEERVGLIRVNKGQHGRVNDKSQPVFGDSPFRFGSLQLFGTFELPSSGTVLKLKRSALLRYQLRPEDDRALEKKSPTCRGVNCQDEEGGTDYLAAGTTVRIVGYQMHAHLFVLIEVVKTESRDPYRDEQKYVFDFDEVI